MAGPAEQQACDQHAREEQRQDLLDQRSGRPEPRSPLIAPEPADQNQRKQDEYEEKIKKGQERVQELNDRFADWYYIIADDVYQKIRLSRDDLIKKKEKNSFLRKRKSILKILPTLIRQQNMVS